MCNRIVIALVALCAALLAVAGPASAAKRIALVIGNDTYESLNPLGKAVNDSRAVAEALEEIGFTVIKGENTARRDMNKRLSELDSSIAPGDTVFFFFAGHGVAIGAENYLLPIDIPKPRDGEDGLVRDEAHSVDGIISRIRNRGAAVSMVVLDACRDNPFAASGTRNLGAQRGLARIDTPDGVFVLYSAGIGQTALDALGSGDPDPNSVFTRKLVPLLKTAGMTHVALAKTVQQQVDALAATVHHPQQPAYYDQIIGEIVLKPKSAEPTVATAEGTPKALSEAAEAWVGVSSTTSVAVLEAFIARYKGTVFADLAQARLDEVKKSQVATLVDRTITVEPKTEEAAGSAEATVVASAETPEEATVAGAQSADAPTAEAPDPALLARELQTELARVACYQGAIDGDWGRGSAAALERFNEETGLELSSDEPTGAALDMVKAKQETVCPAEKKVTRTKPKSEPKPVVKKSEPKPTKKASTPRKSKTVTAEPKKRKTFIKENGRFDCAIHGTNTALQELQRAAGNCE